MGGLDHAQVSAFSWTPQYNIGLPWDLLAWISMENGIPSPLLILLQLQSYLVLCISARIIIIPKSRNILCSQLISELSSLCI